MDSGLIKTFSRGYRFKINALIYGNKIYEYLPEGYSEIIITHNNKTIEMLPFLIEKIGKDTQIKLVSIEIHKNYFQNTILEVKLEREK